MTTHKKEIKKIEEKLTHLIQIFENNSKTQEEIEREFRKTHSDIYNHLKNFIAYYNYDTTLFGDIFNGLDRLYQDFYASYDKGEVKTFLQDFKTRSQGLHRIFVNIG